MGRKTYGRALPTVLEYLDEHEPATIATIAQATGLPEKTVATTIRRYSKDFVKRRLCQSSHADVIALKEF